MREFQTCPLCSGSGQILADGFINSVYQACPTCGGNRIIERPFDPSPEEKRNEGMKVYEINKVYQEYDESTFDPTQSFYGYLVKNNYKLIKQSPAEVKEPEPTFEELAQYCDPNWEGDESAEVKEGTTAGK